MTAGRTLASGLAAVRRSLFGDLDRRFLLPILASFSSFVGIGAIVPVLPGHIRQDLGASDVAVGFIVGSYSIAALVSRIASGRVVDARGGVFGLRFGLIVCSIAGFLFLVPMGLPGLVAARMAQGVGASFVFASGALLVVDLVPMHERARAMGLLGTGPWGGNAVGPLLGVLLGSFVGTSLVVLLLPLPLLVLVLRMPSPGPRVQPRATRLPSRLMPREAFLPGIALGLVSAGSVTLTGFVVLRLAEVGGGGALAYAGYAGGVVLTRLLLGSIVDRMGSAKGMLMGTLLAATGFAIVALAPSTEIGIAGAVLCGIGVAFPWLAIVTYTFARVGEHEKGAALGVLTAVSDGATFTGSFMAGLIAGNFGYPAAFWAAALALIASGTIVIPAMHEAGERRARDLRGSRVGPAGD